MSYSGAYAAASLLYASVLLSEASASVASSKQEAARQSARDALRAIDLALLRAGVDEWAAVAEPIVREANAFLRENAETAALPAEEEGGAAAAAAAAATTAAAAAAARDKARQAWESASPHFSKGVALGAAPIRRVDARTLDASSFCSQFMEGCINLSPPVAVILTNCVESSWPAFSPERRWSTSYLREKAGERLVPVETYDKKDATSTYLSDSWEQRVMPLAEYIDRYVEGEVPSEDGGKAEKGYLAQHQLFDQIPSLRDDICAPPFCCASTAEDQAAPEGCERRVSPIVSAWLGPSGTVSPLHTDPYHNLLVQVVGHKYVRLYEARQTPRLYPRDGALCNNCHVDLDKPRPEEQPLVEGTPCQQCVLAPGEVLYIPRHEWHYVRSLEISVSVSFWWGAKLALQTRPDGSMKAVY